MEIGIFARTFARPTLGGVLDAVTGHGLRCIQLNLSCAGLPSLPDALPPETCADIRAEMERRGIRAAAVSGTFNMVHPDPEERRRGLRRLRVLAQACADLGTGLITLCTGSRDPENMWCRHPDNDGDDAWNDLLASMAEALEAAEEAGVTLGIEPEVSNVVDTARKARRLLDWAGTPRLKVVFDGANLFHAGELPRMREILTEAVELLGPDILLAHAKDLSRDGQAGDRAAGTGVLDYDLYLGLLHRAGYHGPLVLHGLSEAEVPGSVQFLRERLVSGEW